MLELSKSKLLAFRQCQRRLWLEVHHKELRIDTPDAKESFELGNDVGAIARKHFDPQGQGVIIDVEPAGIDQALAHSALSLASNRPIFEAGFQGGGGIVFADVMLPVIIAGQNAWRMIEVKSSTGVKDHHRDEVAIQAFVANAAAINIHSASLALINSSFVYPGNGDYEGLFIEIDLTVEAIARRKEVANWIAEAKEILRKRDEPTIKTGKHCIEPYECGFLKYCKSKEPKANYPIEWLPGINAKLLKQHIFDDGVFDMESVQDTLLNERQQRVKEYTLSGETFFDQAGAAADLAAHELPVYFMDFEAVNFVAPIWKGTHPYQQIPFQFSVHRLSDSEELHHVQFLDLSGNDPTERFALELIAACGQQGAIFVYNAGFETSRIGELADRIPRLSQELLSINSRVVDLLPIARSRYYHPAQKGSWSIKGVLPCVAPDLRYDLLDGVQDGGMAVSAYLEAISADVSAQRKRILERQLLAYCELDTFAMVHIWNVFSGQNVQLLKNS
jgi:CRISPR/Cas system-associated exonuclease Cas4 (RecB family)